MPRLFIPFGRGTLNRLNIHTGFRTCIYSPTMRKTANGGSKRKRLIGIGYDGLNNDNARPFRTSIPLIQTLKRSPERSCAPGSFGSPGTVKKNVQRTGTSKPVENNTRGSAKIGESQHATPLSHCGTCAIPGDTARVVLEIRVKRVSERPRARCARKVSPNSIGSIRDEQRHDRRAVSHRSGLGKKNQDVRKSPISILRRGPPEDTPFLSFGGTFRKVSHLLCCSGFSRGDRKEKNGTL